MNKRKPGQLRIISGKWRHRIITMPKNSDIRPTPDRVRETVFNWLQQDILGSKCLDLCCGSGSLGLEALSRGASHVTFVDIDNSYLENINSELIIHAPELFFGDHTLDLTAIDNDYRKQSLNEMKKTIKVAKTLKKYFNNKYL